MVLRITATGICGSDLHGYTGENGLVWAVRWWRRTPPSPGGDDAETPWDPTPWLVLAAAGAVVGSWSARTAGGAVKNALYLAAVRGGGAILLVAVGLSLLRHVRRRPVFRSIS